MADQPDESKNNNTPETVEAEKKDKSPLTDTERETLTEKLVFWNRVYKGNRFWSICFTVFAFLVMSSSAIYFMAAASCALTAFYAAKVQSVENKLERSGIAVEIN